MPDRARAVIADGPGAVVVDEAHLNVEALHDGLDDPDRPVLRVRGDVSLRVAGEADRVVTVRVQDVDAEETLTRQTWRARPGRNLTLAPAAHWYWFDEYGYTRRPPWGHKLNLVVEDIIYRSVVVPRPSWVPDELREVPTDE